MGQYLFSARDYARGRVLGKTRISGTGIFPRRHLYSRDLHNMKKGIPQERVVKMTIPIGDHIGNGYPLKEKGIPIKVEGHLIEEGIPIGMGRPPGRGGYSGGGPPSGGRPPNDGGPPGGGRPLMMEDPLMVEDPLMTEDPLIVEDPLELLVDKDHPALKDLLDQLDL